MAGYLLIPARFSCQYISYVSEYFSKRLGEACPGTKSYYLLLSQGIWLCQTNMGMRLFNYRRLMLMLDSGLVPLGSCLRRQGFFYAPQETQVSCPTFTHILDVMLYSMISILTLLWPLTDKAITVSDEWRKRVHQQPDDFMVMFKELGTFPSVHLLYNWNTWLTPIGLKVNLLILSNPEMC